MNSNINIAYCPSCKKYFSDIEKCPNCEEKLTNHLQNTECVVAELNISESMLKARDKEISTFALSTRENN